MRSDGSPWSKRFTIALALLMATAAAGCSRWNGASAPAKSDSRERKNQAGAEGSQEVAASTKSVYRGQLLAMTGNADSPVKVWDPDGKPVLDPYYFLDKKGLALVDRDYTLRLEGGCFYSGGTDEYLGGALRSSGGELTLSAYVHPAAASQEGTGCIIGYGPPRGDLLFALMQDKNVLTFNLGAAKPRKIRLLELKAAEPFHLVVTVGKQEVVFYRNGEKVGAHPGIRGDCSGWANGILYFGNDRSGARPWRGWVELAALHNRALVAEEAAKAAAAVLEEVRKRQPVPRIEVEGALLSRPKYHVPWDEGFTYREALAVCEYRVTKVVQGEFKEDKIWVAEWMYVDQIFLTNSRKEIGSKHRLVVERLDVNPQLSRTETAEPPNRDIDTVVYYDLSPIKALPESQQPAELRKAKQPLQKGSEETR